MADGADSDPAAQQRIAAQIRKENLLRNKHRPAWPDTADMFPLADACAHRDASVPRLIRYVSLRMAFNLLSFALWSGWLHYPGQRWSVRSLRRTRCAARAGRSCTSIPL